MNTTISLTEGDLWDAETREATLDRALRAIAAEALPALGDWCFIDAIGRAREVERLAVIAPKGTEKSVVTALEQPPQQLDWAALSGDPAIDQPSLVLDPLCMLAPRGESESESVSEYRNALETIQPTSMIVVRIGSPELVLGTLWLLYTSKQHKHSQLAAAEKIGQRISAILEAVRMHSGMRRAQSEAKAIRDRLAALAKVAAGIATASSETSLLEALIAEVVEADCADAVVAVLSSPRPPGGLSWLSLSATDSTPSPLRVNVTLAAICRNVVAHGRPEYVSSLPVIVAPAFEAEDAAARTRAVAAVPLKDSGEVLGALTFGFSRARTFSPSDREFYELLGQCCASALRTLRSRHVEEEVKSTLDQVSRRAARARDFASKMLVSVPGVTSVLSGPDHRVTWVNAAAMEAVGAQSSEIIGRTHAELAPELHQKIAAALEEVYSRAEPRVLPEVEIESDGEARCLRVSMIPLATDEERETSVVLMTLDITEQKRLEKQRAELLEREQRARARAEAADRMKDEFLARVSHELATPLAAMRMWTHLLVKKSGGAFAPEVTAIERCADAQSRMVRDLLDVSRALRGKLSMEKGMLDFSALVGGVVETFRPEAIQNEIALEVVLAEEAYVEGDSARLNQVVTNLLSNAMKFTPPGGRVQVRVRVEDDVELVVEDNGMGIEPTVLPNVFEAFWQADGSATRSHGGLGLGLAIVRQIVDLHGGSVRAESEGHNRGAKLTVKLALAGTADIAEFKSAVIKEETSLDGLDVLVVEDDAETRSAVTTVLGSFGARVRAAESASRGWRELESSVPDVLLCDLAMPGEDGYSLIRRIRAAHGPEARVLAIAFTAHGRDEDRRRVLEAGFDDHLIKPLAPPQLAAAIARISRAH